jgi:hypothetical protein
MRGAHQIGDALDIRPRILAIEEHVIEAGRERGHEIGGREFRRDADDEVPSREAGLQ